MPCSRRNNPSHPRLTHHPRFRPTHDPVAAANSRAIRPVVHPALMAATLRGIDAIVVPNIVLAPRRNDHTIRMVTPRDMYDHRVAGALVDIIDPPVARACMSNQTPTPIGCLWWRRSGRSTQTSPPRPRRTRRRPHRVPLVEEVWHGSAAVTTTTMLNAAR
jgi:hypothetical protein